MPDVHQTEVTNEDLCPIVRGLLEDLRHAQTIADVAIAAGIALELLELLG